MKNGSNCEKFIVALSIAVCDKNGQGVTQSYSKAVEWYTKAAEQGDTDAQDALKRLK